MFDLFRFEKTLNFWYQQVKSHLDNYSENQSQLKIHSELYEF